MGFDKEAGSSSHSIPVSREDTDTPLLAKPIHTSSQFKTFANIFIAIVGAGVLGLPYTFMRSGWLFGVLTLFSVAALTYHCMMLLVDTRRKLETLNGFAKITSFGDLGFAVCGPIGRAAVDLMIILSQAGFCVSYLIFIATTCAHLLTGSQTLIAAEFNVNKSWFVWGCFPFQLGLNSIRTLTQLAPLSIFADVLQIGAMGIVIVKDSVVFVQEKPQVQAFTGWAVFSYCVGICVYAFEGIGMVLPLEAEAKEKDKFGKTLAFSMAAISLLFGGFGVMGYLAFGDETRGIITTNMGSGLLSSLVQLGLCVNLFFTFPLMMNPVYEVLERRFAAGSYSLWLRWVTVLCVSLVALLVPNFADFLSLVGSSVCIALGFVFPSLFHMLVFRESMGRVVLLVDAAIVVIGLLLAVSGTWMSLAEILSTRG